MYRNPAGDLETAPVEAERKGVAIMSGFSHANNQKKQVEMGRLNTAYGGFASSSLLACCCASWDEGSEGSGEGSRMQGRGWGLVYFLINV